jgi:tRNA1Val (adenine37-N6)-methyltransferase
MGNPWFQFKQFRITQEKSALRVGTDGVLLGAWCSVAGTKSILDVGTGTGVIALMLAQRTDNQINRGDACVVKGQIHGHTAKIDFGADRNIDNRNELESNYSAPRIDAFEISAEACQDASVNFCNSPWKDRLTLHCIDFRQFQPSGIPSFDLIVSNPPFFKNSLRSADHFSSVARHDVTLTFEQLISGAKKLLKPEGRLAVIIPSDASEDFRETARLAGFYLSRKTLVIPRTGRKPKRVLLEFSVLPCYPVCDELEILLNDLQYSDAFLALTKEFYL